MAKTLSCVKCGYFVKECGKLLVFFSIVYINAVSDESKGIGAAVKMVTSVCVEFVWVFFLMRLDERF